VTFNDVDTYDYFRDSLVDLKESDHDPSDKEEAAKDVIFDDDTEHQGIIYQDEESVPYHERHGVDEDMSVIPDGAPEGATDLVREFLLNRPEHAGGFSTCTPICGRRLFRSRSRSRYPP